MIVPMTMGMGNFMAMMFVMVLMAVVMPARSMFMVMCMITGLMGVAGFVMIRVLMSMFVVCTVIMSMRVRVFVPPAMFMFISG